MADAFVRKIQPDREGMDFEGLRKEGIRLVQDISGEVWTDYNLHDPGVTLLEAFCYALTDLIYRTRFDVADYLVAEDGSIDFRRQVLYRPDEIFPTHPVTESDYRKLILSCDPDIDNVWIRPDDAKGAQGLYRIYVLLNDRVKHQDREDVKKVYADKVRKRYLDNRNLCEDLAGVEIVERIPYSLCGEIEIGGKREPEKILAEIYSECMQYLCPEVPFHSYIGEYKQGKPLEVLFDGVLAGPGYIDDDELYPWRGDFLISDLIGRVARIDGVRNINHLQFVDPDGEETDTITLEQALAHRKVPCLRHAFEAGGAEAEPSTPGIDVKDIRIVKSGKRYHVQALDVAEELKRLSYKRRISRQRKQHFDWVGTMLPSGTFRNIREYSSFQNHLPDIYGLNAYGVPDSASPKRKAQAAQLKAYLVIFDQVMADFLEMLQETQRLFSLDEHLHQSYFHQLLHNDAVPNIEALYPDGVEGMGSGLAHLMQGFDHFGDRRNRALDYLLGLYGERLVQSSLRHFSHGDMNFEDESVRNKIAFLKDIVDLTSKRFVAFNYNRPADGGRNMSVLKKKLAHLLGLKGRNQDRSSEADTRLQEGDYHLVEHLLLRPMGTRAHPGPAVHDGFYAFRLSFVFPADIAGSPSEEFRKLVMETIHLNCPAHIHPEVHWLDPERMDPFVRLHKRWLKLKRASSEPYDELDAVAGELAHFLRESGGARE